MRRSATALVGGVAAAAMGLATACGLPTSGPVEQGLPIDAPAGPAIRLEFEAPRPGATPEQVVLGFLAAQWSADDGYRAARAYLTADASKVWRPRSVVVYPDSSRPTTRVSDDGRTVTVSIPEGATLDALGRFSASPVGTAREVEMTLEQVSGEWRVSGLPDDFGLWLSQFYFDRAYRELQIAYVSRAGTTMVPDWRRFAVGPGLTTSLSRAMLDPVPEYLAPAVLNGYPAGTSLAVDAVPLAGGDAQIDLTSRALAMDGDTRRAAWAQALRTMRQVPGVSAVSLLVDGRPLDIVGFDGAPRTVAELGFEGAASRSAVVLRRVGDILTPVSSTSFPMPVDVPGLVALPRVAPQWRHAAVSDDLRDVLAVNEDGSALSRWISAEPVPVSVPGSALTPPAFDQFGFAWITGTDPSGRQAIWTLPTAGDLGASTAAEATRMDAPWLQGRRVLGVRPAPEAYRAVVLSESTDGRVRLDLVGIERDADRVPVSLGAPWAVGRDVAAASSVMWIDDSTLGLIGSKVPEGDLVPLIVPLASGTQEHPPIAGLESLVSLGGERGLVGVTSANEVVRRAGAAWQRVGNASDVIVPAR